MSLITINVKEPLTENLKCLTIVSVIVDRLYEVFKSRHSITLTLLDIFESIEL